MTKAASLETEIESTTQNTVLNVHPQDIYQAVLPFILNNLQQPKDAKSTISNARLVK